ncbi:MAG TPA: phosphoribosyltransferase, partial [Candidatus Pacearchaeota archaeon]|nr:phosphoribosyltransferase [Candidatus Pacearchaeota archaeon]
SDILQNVGMSANNMGKVEVGFWEIEKIIGKFAGDNKDFLDKVEFVVGVSRGGLVPAALLAAKIDKPLAAAYINKQDEIFFDRGEWIAGKNVLVVDDVIRSGKTLWLVKNHLQKCCRPKSISFFVLFKVKSLQNEDYRIQSFSREIDEDVVFPWD